MKRHRKKRASPLDKHMELSKSIQNHWLSVTFFALGALSSLLSFALKQNVQTALIFVLTVSLLILTIRGIRKLYKFKKLFHASPHEYMNETIPKPVLIRAIYWIIPRFHT